METTHVGIVGLGTVGSGVAKILLEQSTRIARHAGRQLKLQHAVVRDLKKSRGIEISSDILSDELSKITDNAQISVVAQLIGGLEPARSIMLQLLAAGKDVVTANKALLAEHGPELFDKARELGRSIAFEASVAGGIPIITNISQCLSANQITSLRGILNGTSNFIVSQMEESGMKFDDAVRLAQQLGYAEADPAMDVDGSDAAQKLAILAHLAFGSRVGWKDIPRTGIDSLDPADLRFATELGYRIKLLAIAQLTDHGLELHVSPSLVKIGRPLAEVREAYNAVGVVGDAVGRVFFQGLGAGQMPTASAVVADLIDMATGRTKITFQTLELWSRREARVDIREHDETPGRYYLRFSIKDHPGVLGDIASVLAQHEVSIASVIQHEPDGDSEGSLVPLVIMTHTATEGGVRQAVEQIELGESVKQGSVRMRVLD